MAQAAFAFDEITSPLGGDLFRRDYLGQKPLHLKGDPGKWRHLMSWEILDRLLGMTTIWSPQTLMLMLDKEPIPPAEFTSPTRSRDGGQVLRPDPIRVQRLIERGATLVLNEIDQLTPELSAFSASMEAALGGKVQMNLYCSSKRRQGFAAHFDTHDVFAVHAEGEKVWHIYEGRAQDPIAHPMFKTLPQAHHEKAKGGLLEEVRLRPGDLLYLPRGQYHDALADDGGCIHIAVGVTYPIGIDVVTALFERMVAEPLCRANLPRGDDAALARRVAEIADRIGEVMREPAVLEQFSQFVRTYRWPRDTYDVRARVEARAGGRIAVTAAGMRLIQAQGRWGLVKAGSREALEVPATVAPMVAWVLQRSSFERGDLAAAFPMLSPAALAKLIGELSSMRLISGA